MLEGDIETAASLIRSWGAVVVLGAGASFASGLPLSRDLQGLLWHSLDADPEARGSLASRLHENDRPAKALIKHDQRKSIAGLEVIRTHAIARRAYQYGFARLNDRRAAQPSSSHDCLAKLFHAGRVEVLVSLNWDTIFEVSYQRIYGALPDRRFFHKPHGDAASPEVPWILPHEKGSIPETLAAQLHSLTSEHPRVLLILGYSERDEVVVSKIVEPLERQWHVIRVGPTATGNGAIRGSVELVMPKLFPLMELPSELPGWEYISFLNQGDLSKAFLGRRLGASDVVACPRLQEVENLKRLLKQRCSVWLWGSSGSGKSITAYQAVSDLVNEGWEAVRLVDLKGSPAQIVNSVSNLRRKTLLLLEDVERVDSNLVVRLNEMVSSRLFLLCTAGSDTTQDMASLKIDAKRAVAEIASKLTQQRSTTLEAVTALDNRVGDGFLDTPLEMRIEEAAKSETPWQFMFVLTGGWRRTRDELKALSDKRHVLLLTAIAARQLVTLDSPVSAGCLDSVCGPLEIDKKYISDTVRNLRGRRLLLGDDESFQCPHRRFASAVLEIVCEDAMHDVRVELFHILREVLEFASPPLRGISWLLHELRLTDAWRQLRGSPLITRQFFVRLIERCFDADSAIARRDALFVLEALLEWHDEIMPLLSNQARVLTSWLNESSAEYAGAFAHMLNQLSQRDRELAKCIMDSASPEVVAGLASLATVANAVAWGQLLEESWHASRPWQRRLASRLNSAKLMVLFKSVPPSDVYQLGVMASGIAVTNLPLALRLMEHALPTILGAIHTNFVDTSAAIDETFIWRVLGFHPLLDKKPSLAQNALARKLVGRLQPRKIAKVLTFCRQRDWEQFSRFLFFVRSISKPRWKAIVSAIDVKALDLAASKLWNTVPSELEHLLRAISDPPTFEPARSILSKHGGEIALLRPILVILSPESSVIRIRNGGRVNLHIDTGSGWRWAALALHLLSKHDKAIALQAVRENTASIASGFSQLQRLDAEHLPLFVEVLKSTAKEVSGEIATLLNVEQARSYWGNRMKGNRAEKKAVAVVSRFLRVPS